MLRNDKILSEGCIFLVDRAVKRWYFQILGAVFSMYLEVMRVVIHLAALLKERLYLYDTFDNSDRCRIEFLIHWINDTGPMNADGYFVIDKSTLTSMLSVR